LVLSSSACWYFVWCLVAQHVGTLFGA